ncbi:hypothetical protein TELCIR_03590 [Teladorsagia circumcincta]|uniref:Glycosyltransferase family 92 protein n=1 Tax=Teladorsagia circumcincta TaxID=45464 RepID=A0A2G9UVY9_TELCI|nr:hypothetical protein TELCIR_03590 [Teladorsagia circumcincta]
MCISMIFFVIAIDYRKRKMIELEDEKRKQYVKSDFLDDVDYALETMKYMHDMQRGKAEIRNVVEKEDVSIRLVEWLEAQYLMGVSTVTTYVYTVPKRVKTVLDHYGKLGKLEQVPLTLPGHSPNLPLVRSQYIARNRQQKRRHELIPYNDCLYRHISTHRYILILDIDELIVPMEHNNYFDLLKTIEQDTPSDRITSLSFPNVFKFPSKLVNQSIPEHLYMLRNSHRSRKTSDRRNYGKSMTSTANVATVFNHFALHRLTPNVTGTIYVPERLGVKLHYKGTCPIESRNECDELQTDTVLDHSIDRFADELERRVNQTLSELRFL